MNKEEKDIEIVKEITFVRGIRKDVEGEREDLLALEEVLNLIDKLQKENKNYKELILAIKGKLNNIQFEVEQAWRKIEKLESKYE